MSNIRVRITKGKYTGVYIAHTVAKSRSLVGTIEERHVNQRAKKDLEEYGFTYININRDFIV